MSPILPLYADILGSSQVTINVHPSESSAEFVNFDFEAFRHDPSVPIHKAALSATTCKSNVIVTSRAEP
jgi:hypothetical protein